MSVYRRLARSKKGIATVFGALFFVVIIIMGFNVMLWTFIQYNAYNGVVTSSGILTQQANSENLVFNPPGAYEFTTNSFNITVGNEGGVTVTVARIYITNVSPSGSTQCELAALCTVNPPPSSMYFTGANIQPGQLNHVITVNGITINDGSTYQVVLATTRGRQFSFSYPWPAQSSGASNSNSTNTDHGALDVSFQVNSFNFTMDSWTTSKPAWQVPYDQTLVFWIKITNNALYPITLSQYSDLYLICERYGQTGDQDCEDTQSFFIVANSTINPHTGLVAYNQANNPITLPAAGPNGPNGYTIVKFAALSPGTNTAQSLDYENEVLPYLFFLVLYYTTQGQTVGQALDYFAVLQCPQYPNQCS
jgi:hypothetical protein